MLEVDDGHTFGICMPPDFNESPELFEGDELLRRDEY